MIKLQLLIIGILILAVQAFAQPVFDLSIDNNWINLSVEKYETHCFARYTIDFSIQNNNINIILKDTAEQKCKQKCNIAMEFDIYQVPTGNYNLYVYLDESNLLSNKENRKLLYKKDLKITSNFAKSPLSYNFRHTICNANIEEKSNTGIEVYPNPSNSKLTVKFGLKSKADVSFKILNFLGKEVLNYEKKGLSQGSQVLNIESDNLQPGMYIGKLNASNGQVYSFKILWSK